MSYHCHYCDKVHEGTELRITSEVRPVKYKRYGLKTEKTRDKEKEKTKMYNGDYEGWEIAKEVKVCDTCYSEKKDVEPTKIPAKNAEFFGKKKIQKDEDDFYSNYAEYMDREYRNSLNNKEY